jgi:hypothetical protein
VHSPRAQCTSDCTAAPFTHPAHYARQQCLPKPQLAPSCAVTTPALPLCSASPMPDSAGDTQWLEVEIKTARYWIGLCGDCVAIVWRLCGDWVATVWRLGGDCVAIVCNLWLLQLLQSTSAGKLKLLASADTTLADTRAGHLDSAEQKHRYGTREQT